MTLGNTSDKREMSIRLFGDFEISDGEKSLNKNGMRSDMVTKLLAFLVSRDSMGSTMQELTDTFWSGDNSGNPAGALKNLIYRMRKELEKLWPDENFFLTGRGSYQWNTEIPVKVDVKEMYRYLKLAESSDDDEIRMRYLRKAVKLYRGKVLADYSNEYWVMAMQAYCHGMYLNAVKELCELYRQKDMFREMEEICLIATAIDPLDEKLHCLLMEAYIGENKQAMAQAHYQETVKLLYDSLGVDPSEELKEIYNKALTQIHSQEADLEVIRADLKEAQRNEGAFYCEYGVFKKVYELEARRVGRVGMAIFLALITMNVEQEPKSKQTPVDLVTQSMDQMQEILMDCLRSGDLVTRYSSRQFLVMLQGCNYENAIKVMERVTGRYYKLRKRVKAGIQYNLKEMEI